jgi:2-oxo-3-hexenedioate decarboxylase
MAGQGGARRRGGIEMSNERIEAIAGELMSVLGTGKTVEPFSKRFPGFDLNEAYVVAERVCELRQQRGQRVVGRKIGFTNAATQKAFGVAAPIWNYMFDTTVREIGASGTFALAGTCAVRIEPEIVLHLASAPRPGMSEAELAACVDWVAHGYEMVDAIFPNWSFTAPDAVAGYGVHAALLRGPQHSITANRTDWSERLKTFTIRLTCGDGTTRSGSGANVLGSPLIALKYLIDEIARYPQSRPVEAGEIITTGTLTDAMPVATGQAWATELAGIALDGIRVEFR